METDDTKEQLEKAIASYIEKHLYRISDNLNRVLNLVKLSYELHIKQLKAKKKPGLYEDDLLRAAVVFLHATLEDFLRYVGMLYLPGCGEEALNQVALSGTSDVVRPEKFFLGRLAQHRGKTVDQVLKESVDGYLNRLSFSDPTDISRFLEMVGVDVQLVRPLFGKLGELTARRHQIVHCADLIDSTNQHQARQAAPIHGDTVLEWHKSVTNFMSRVIAEK